MAELHDALKYLAPVEWSEVPRDDAEQLQQYMTSSFTAAELIANSVPPVAHGTPFGASKPFHTEPNTATSLDQMHPSEARAQPPHPDHEGLQKHWGKPVKFNKKDNPLDIHVYKMAGHGRRGAWFARRSIHEGIGFDKFKSAMMREFAESLAVTGGPGAGAIRGIAADRRLEDVEAPGVGRLQVYHLSAQFPGPVTPRDFTIMTSTSDDVLTDKSAAELDGGRKHVPRHYMIVSNPVDHPDGAQRSGYVRGQYESVELIREIPLSVAGSQADGAPDDSELNPVEWIMITRSDPGGGIPRFMVERGTPDAMLADVHKFFNWATRQTTIAGPDEDVERQLDASKQTVHPEQNGTAPEELVAKGEGESGTGLPAQAGVGAPNGVFSTLTKALDTYAPASVAGLAHYHLDPAADDVTSDDSSETSVDSFMSAEELKKMTTAEENLPRESTDSLSVATGDLSDAAVRDKPRLNRHEKEVLKLSQKRERLDQRLAQKRLDEQDKLRQSLEKDESEATKHREKMEKELQKTEEKHRREMDKLERKRDKEARKAEARRRKRDEQSKLSLVSRERDDFRSQADLLRRENGVLREQVAHLQAQNTALADRLAAGDGSTLKPVGLDESGGRRSTSTKSHGSKTSLESATKEL